MPATFGERFKMLRNEKVLKQQELIDEFNKKYHYSFTKAAVSQYENNKRIPEIDALKSFADFFNVSVDFLLGNTDVREKIDQSLFSGAGILKDLNIYEEGTSYKLLLNYIKNQDNKNEEAKTLKNEFIDMLKKRDIIKTEGDLTPALAFKILSEIFEDEKRGTD